MSSATVYSAIYTWFTANWTSTIIYWENAASKPPTDGSAWMYVELVDADYVPGSIGAGLTSAERWRERGYLLAHIFVGVGEGSLTARTYAESLANSLRGLELSPAIRFQDLQIGTMPGVDNGNWWGITVRADWIRN